MKSPPPSGKSQIKIMTSSNANTNTKKDKDNANATTTTLGSSAVVFKRQPSDDVINNLKLIADGMASFVGGHDSISSLSLCVNDSAGGEVTFEDTYEIDGILGEGGFATVYRCIHVDNGQEYAVKEIINTNYEDGNSIKREIMALKRLKEGPYVVRLLDVFKEPDQTHMIMEELKGGDLLQRLCEKKFYEPEPARKLSRTLIEAIKFCHSKQIVHRDIKPENILLISPTDDSKIKLADFGCAKRFIPGRSNQLKTLCGTQAYVAPEILLQDDSDPHNSGYDERCDLWSCGVLIYTMLAGYLPFDDADDDMLPEYIVAGDYEFHEKYWDDIPKSITTLISGLLTVNPDDRWTCNQALDGEWLMRYSSSHHTNNKTISRSTHSTKSFSSWNDSDRSNNSSSTNKSNPSESSIVFDLSLASLAEGATERENDDHDDDDEANNNEEADDDVSSIGGGGSLCLEDLS